MEGWGRGSFCTFLRSPNVSRGQKSEKFFKPAEPTNTPGTQAKFADIFYRQKHSTFEAVDIQLKTICDAEDHDQ